VALRLHHEVIFQRSVGSSVVTPAPQGFAHAPRRVMFFSAIRAEVRSKFPWRWPHIPVNDPEIALQFQCAPDVDCFARQLRQMARTLDTFLHSSHRRLSAARDAEGAHDAPQVVVAAQPHFANVLNRLFSYISCVQGGSVIGIGSASAYCW
jgi:hypothetical protein